VAHGLPLRPEFLQHADLPRKRSERQFNSYQIPAARNSKLFNRLPTAWCSEQVQLAASRGSRTGGQALAISSDLRKVIEEEWPGLVYKLPPKE
jgi:hypothetical protein